MESRPLTIVVAGVGGYGNLYLSALLDAPDRSGFRIAGAVDPAPERCPRIADVRAGGIPVYPSPEAFYAEHTADLAVLATPIQLHARHTRLALERRSHVLCEKPLCATLEQVNEMREARDRAGRLVTIGYQWSFSEPIQTMKRDIRAGRFGRPLRFRTLSLAPRGEDYYGRNDWAGAQYDREGLPVFDSPVNNSCAHYLHNMFYVLGDRPDRSAYPAAVQAERYRVNPIGNYDTCVLRGQTKEGVEFLFAASHAVPRKAYRLSIRYEFENAAITYDERSANFRAQGTDGTVTDYGRPQSWDSAAKLWHIMDCIRGGTRVLCGIEAAGAQTACMCAVQNSAQPIMPFSPSLVREEGESGKRLHWVEGLEAGLDQCYEKALLPSELGLEWAECGRRTEGV